MRSYTHYQEQLQFRGPVGLSAAVVTAARRDHTSVSEFLRRTVLARLAEVGVPAGKVRTIDEVFTWDQTTSQGLLVDVDHSVLGPLTLPGPPLRFFETDGTEVTRQDHLAPPTLDQHGASVRAWLQEDPGSDGDR